MNEKGPFFAQVSTIVERGEEFLRLLAGMGFSPNQKKVLERVFSGKDAEKMVGRTSKTIAKLYSDNAPNQAFYMPTKYPSGRAAGFSLEQINAMRDHFNTRPGKNNKEKTFTLAVQSFKGGAGKSVTTVHLAQYLALRGYKILVMDCDPQASTTSSFGYIPDLSFTDKNTILPYLEGDQDTLHYAIQKTYFSGIDLIPGCLSLFEAEFGLYNARFQEKNPEAQLIYWEEFKHGLATISDDYDIVLLDSPPALGMISINIMTAADGIVVPTPPSLYDFASTTQYFRMAERISQSLPNKDFAFMKILATRVDGIRPAAQDFINHMRDEFGKYMYKNEFRSIGIIPTAASYFKTLYDISPKDRDKHQLQVNKKQIQMLNAVFSEILNDIHVAWSRKSAI